MSKICVFAYIAPERMDRDADRAHAKNSALSFAHRHHLQVEPNSWREFRSAPCEDGTFVSGFSIDVLEGDYECF